MSKVTVVLSDGSTVVRDSADGDVNLDVFYERFGPGNVLVDGEPYVPPAPKATKPKKAKKAEEGEGAEKDEEDGEDKDDAPT